MSEQQPAGDGWIEWGGGECPVPHGTRVEVKRRGGWCHGDLAGKFSWSHIGDRHDVVGYRVVEPAKEAPPVEREISACARCGLHTCAGCASKEWAAALAEKATSPEAKLFVDECSAFDSRAFFRPEGTKDTNPKDAIGNGKLDLGLVPDTATAYAALAFTEGALKYGRFNWRIAGVRASIYHAALKRHLARWWNGEWADPATNVPHLASVLACASILIDAHECAKLTDDRPPPAPLGAVCDSGAGMTLDLQALFADFNPHQYTIADGKEQQA